MFYLLKGDYKRLPDGAPASGDEALPSVTKSHRLGSSPSRPFAFEGVGFRVLGFWGFGLRGLRVEEFRVCMT